MDLVKITDLTGKLGISSRSLRYYEQVGLIQSARPEFEKYRYYDAENIERLKQIMVLRKMQIPVKDILRIYESQDMRVVVATFVERMSAIDREVNALFELRRITNEFLQTMLKNGIKKISALPLLYDEMEERLEFLQERAPVTYDQISAAAEKLQGEINLDIIDLQPMRMLSSRMKETGLSDPYGFWNWLRRHNVPAGLPGRHELFEFQDAAGNTVMLQKTGPDFKNSGPYTDVAFPGGLFAVGSVFVDEDIGGFHRAMVKSFNENKYYEVDFRHDGQLRHETLIETVLSPDEKRERVLVLLPVKKRLMDVSNYDPNERIYDISSSEIQSANPILWSRPVPIQGEREYLHWQYPKISTGIFVRYPFRVDIEFRIAPETGRYAWDASSGVSCVLFEFNNESYGINMGNNADQGLSEQAIRFHQPIIGNRCSYPGLGKVNVSDINHLAWIVGETHFAVIINDEVRYCGIHFPYMKMNLSAQPCYEIKVDSHGLNRVFFRKIIVSQLKSCPKIKLNKGATAMITKQSNNLLPDIRGVLNGGEGKNYRFDDCMAFMMERAGDKLGLNYWLFAGLTGDSLSQVYHRNPSTFCECCVSGYLSGPEYIGYVFDTIGYEHTYVTAQQINANKTMYLQTLMSYIDKGLPVLVRTSLKDTPGISADALTHFLYVGYEEEGKTLQFIYENDAALCRFDATGEIRQDWIFIGEKKSGGTIEEIVKKAIRKMPCWLTLPEQDGVFFGPAAFRAWAEDIEGGRYDNETDLWGNYGVYVCNLATNAGNGGRGPNIDAQFFLTTPEYRDMWPKISEQYVKMSNINGVWKALEALGGGFNVTLDALKDKERRKQIAGKLREAADCLDQVLIVLKANLK